MAEKVLIARVFVKGTRLSDSEKDAVVTSRVIPITDWTKLNTKGEVSISFDDSFIEVDNDQVGTTGVYGDERKVTLKIPISASSFDALAKYANLDPDWTSGATGLDIGDIRGVQMRGMSFIIYAKDLDPTNNTDTPDVTVDDQTYVIYEAVRNGALGYMWDGSQNILTLELQAMASTSTGSSAGKTAFIGTLTAA
jgi:hypothetical protein